MGLNAHIRLENDNTFREAFRNCTERTRRSLVRRAIVAGSTPTLKKFRSNVRALDGDYVTGTLAKFVGRRAKTIRFGRRGGESFVVIGARRGIVEDVEQPDGEVVDRRPSRYLHLVEFGTSTTHAQPVLRNAVDATRAQVHGRTVDFLRKYITLAMQRKIKTDGPAEVND